MVAKALSAAGVRRRMYPIYDRIVGRTVRQLFFMDLLRQTRNFYEVKWRGVRIWQNVLDLWTIAETIQEVAPDLLIECGSYDGGSALFYGDLMELAGKGRVISIDIEKRHEHAHPRVEFWIADSTSAETVARVRAMSSRCHGPVMVILDSDHTQAHVRREMDAYASLVTPGSYMLVQDGVIDTIPTMRSARPGPLPAIRGWLSSHPEFEVDKARCERFLITHHPSGWLRRRPAEPSARPSDGMR